MRLWSCIGLWWEFILCFLRLSPVALLSGVLNRSVLIIGVFDRTQAGEDNIFFFLGGLSSVNKCAENFLTEIGVLDDAIVYIECSLGRKALESVPLSVAYFCAVKASRLRILNFVCCSVWQSRASGQHDFSASLAFMSCFHCFVSQSTARKGF